MPARVVLVIIYAGNLKTDIVEKYKRILKKTPLGAFFVVTFLLFRLPESILKKTKGLEFQVLF